VRIPTRPQVGSWKLLREQGRSPDSRELTGKSEQDVSLVGTSGTRFLSCTAQPSNNYPPSASAESNVRFPLFDCLAGTPANHVCCCQAMKLTLVVNDALKLVEPAKVMRNQKPCFSMHRTILLQIPINDSPYSLPPILSISSKMTTSPGPLNSSSSLRHHGFLPISTK
jgi:hypothetical protein